MRNSDVPMMALRRAVQLCNGVNAPDDALNVSSAALERWISGEEEVPPAVVTQAVGLFLEATATRAPKRSTPDSNDGGRRGGGCGRHGPRGLTAGKKKPPEGGF